MNLIPARNIAEDLSLMLAPFCTRLEIAGSIRRQKPHVKDVELVCIPDPEDLSRFCWIVDGWPRVKGQATGLYTQRRVAGGMMLDLFMCGPETWGCIYLIRTGSADFSAALMRYAKTVGFAFKDGRLLDPDGKPVATPEEADVFRALGLEWVDPADRHDGSALRRIA